MILAAGKGERMLPLTATTPKPLLQVRGKALVAWHLERLAGAGITQVVINVHYLAAQICDFLGDGSAYGVRIYYSHEPRLLETAGGIYQALEILDEGQADEPFMVINGDIFTDYDFALLATDLQQWQALLVMVANPAHHPQGDFSLSSNGSLGLDLPRLTYSGMGLFRPSLFRGLRAGPVMLRELFLPMLAAGTLGGMRHTGAWTDVGTPARLAALNKV
jgi:N-acetyl-alpha-D-muramate 1-phosphate uridylyltransferase